MEKAVQLGLGEGPIKSGSNVPTLRYHQYRVMRVVSCSLTCVRFLSQLYSRQLRVSCFLMFREAVAHRTRKYLTCIWLNRVKKWAGSRLIFLRSLLLKLKLAQHIKWKEYFVSKMEKRRRLKFLFSSLEEIFWKIKFYIVGVLWIRGESPIPVFEFLILTDGYTFQPRLSNGLPLLLQLSLVLALSWNSCWLASCLFFLLRHHFY